MEMNEAYENWVDTFDCGLVITNKFILEAAWNVATASEREVSDKLEKALEYVLNDETNLIPRATSSCRDHVRSALSEVAAIRAKQAERKGGQTRANA